MRLLLVLIAATAALSSGCGAFAAARSSPESAPDRIVVPGEYVLTLEPGTEGRFLQGILVDLAPTRIQGLGGDAWLVVFAEDPGLPRLSLRVGERIRSVEPHYVSKVGR